MATLRRDKLAAARLPEGVVKACFPVSSVFKFEIGELEGRGKFLLNHPGDAPGASPINFVAGNRVPFYIVWGDNDLEYVQRTSPMMIEALATWTSSEVATALLIAGIGRQPWSEGSRSCARLLPLPLSSLTLPRLLLLAVNAGLLRYVFRLDRDAHGE